MEDLTKQIAESFGCGYQVFEKGSDPELVYQAYLAAFAAGKEDGYYPAVICLNEYVREWLLSGEEEGCSREQLLAGCGNNGREILEERYQEYTGYIEDGGMDDFIGAETQGDYVQEFCSYCSFLDGMLEEDTLLLKIPVKNPWELIAYLPMGGWNDCPAPEEMMEICKYWYEKYKAVPAAFTHDVMEFYAPQRLNGVDSLEAAKEHYAFCADRVDQGTNTYKLSELAAGLEKSDVWYFWWD